MSGKECLLDSQGQDKGLLRAEALPVPRLILRGGCRKLGSHHQEGPARGQNSFASVDSSSRDCITKPVACVVFFF